ncbi:hypothetical protein GCM10007140_05140 [Priestia taiwanensis]|uniref:Uncharacterized protein n=1 Tax=Priestia taiwanensis TaxID=1347902 RepID=A0A917AJL4_9BACI|nr:hypothetical protein GCM10007140_05140 [Priestia taiwanensis]
MIAKGKRRNKEEAPFHGEKVFFYGVNWSREDTLYMDIIMLIIMKWILSDLKVVLIILKLIFK